MSRVYAGNDVVRSKASNVEINKVLCTGYTNPKISLPGPENPAYSRRIYCASLLILSFCIVLGLGLLHGVSLEGFPYR